MKRHPDLQYVLPSHNVMVLSVRHVHACTHFCSVPEYSFFATGPQIPYCEIKNQEQPPRCAVRMKWSMEWPPAMMWAPPHSPGTSSHPSMGHTPLRFRIRGYLFRSRIKGYLFRSRQMSCGRAFTFLLIILHDYIWNNFFDNTDWLLLCHLRKTTRCFWRKHLYPLIEKIKPPAIFCLFNDSELLIKYKASEHRKTYWMLNSGFLSI